MYTYLKPTNSKRLIKLDYDDYLKYRDIKWWLAKQGKHWYAESGKRYKHFKLHSLILNTPKGMVSDHINGDTLDNRKSNLRIVTRKQNLLNSGPSIKNKSGYKGVSWDKLASQWRAQIGFNKKHIYIGLFRSVQEAALAYNEKAFKYFGKYARLNIVKEG